VRTQSFYRLLLLVTAVLGPRLAEAQSLIIPQIADGGGWQTELVATNTTTSAVQVTLTFYEQTTGGATQPWNLPFLEQVNPQNIILPAASTIYLHTANAAKTVAGVGGAASPRGCGRLRHLHPVRTGPSEPGWNRDGCGERKPNPCPIR
jgi:hypothetical protein